MDYCQLQDLKDYLPASKSALNDTARAKIITRASRAIDSFTKRAVDAFQASPAQPSEEIFYGTGEQVLEVSEFIAGSVSAVSDADDNAVLVVEHKGSLRIVDARGRFTNARFEKGAPYTVTARFGFAATPPDITEACLQLATRWWRAKDEGFSGVVGSINRDGSIIERSFPPAVKQLLEPYVLTEREDKEDSEIEVGSLSQSDFYPCADSRFGGWLY